MRESVLKGEKFYSVHNDLAFKLFFADERNREHLIRLLKAILDLDDSEYAGITIIDPLLVPDYKDEKSGILDVKLTTSSGSIVNIEIQVMLMPDMRERIAFYVAKLIVEQLGKGQNYDELNKVISIVIMCDTLFHENDVYHQKFFICDPVTGARLTNILEIHTLEIPKLPAQFDGTDLWQWMKFIEADSEEALNMLVKEHPIMEKPAEQLLELNSDKRSRMIIEAREKALRDERSRIKGAREEGREEGKIEIAMNLLLDGMSYDRVSRITGLTLDKVEEIAKESEK
jgi:predicted transposase/invertase (TIGR01784 family)